MISTICRKVNANGIKTGYGSICKLTFVQTRAHEITRRAQGSRKNAFRNVFDFGSLSYNHSIPVDPMATKAFALFPTGNSVWNVDRSHDN